MKICTRSVDLVDLMVDVKFEFEKSGILMSLGGQNLPFPIDFARGPYHSAACDHNNRISTSAYSRKLQRCNAAVGIFIPL